MSMVTATLCGTCADKLNEHYGLCEVDSNAAGKRIACQACGTRGMFCTYRWDTRGRTKPREEKK